jgi:hypothetical protein
MVVPYVEKKAKDKLYQILIKGCCIQAISAELRDPWHEHQKMIPDEIHGFRY